MLVYAYMRVSTKLQTTENQKLRIVNEGFFVDKWIVEQGVSGSIRALERPEFAKLIEIVKEGDSVCVVSLDRLGRDTEDVLHTIRKFREKGVKLRVMDLDGTDLTSPTGKIMVTLLSMVAEMERDKCIVRTQAGVARAKEEGKVFGRYLKISPAMLKAMKEQEKAGVTFRKMAEEFNVSKDTICSTLRKWGKKMDEYADLYNLQQIQKAQKASSA